jgi:hypothetical protein
MTHNENEQKRLERAGTKFLRENEKKEKPKRIVKKHKKFGKSASRFVKFWLPLKKAVWIYNGIVDYRKLSIPQVEYLRVQLDRELRKHYEGVKNENKV